jgi:SAM-dependent methyltransferase
MRRRERAIRLLPAPLKRVAKAVRAKVDPVYVGLYRRREGYGGVIPPGEVRARAGWPNVHTYVAGGRYSAEQLDAALATIGTSFKDYESILDFGSGAGRVLAHAARRARPGASFTGSDVDAEAIEWAREHRPEASWAVNSAEPPLSFDDERFDLVYSISVFTHLDEQLQLRWLDELRRVMKPGGVALLTTHGRAEFESYRTGNVVSGSLSCIRRVAAHGSLDATGFVHEPYERSTWTRKDFPGTDTSFGLAFHSEDYVRRVWGERFEVLELLPRALAQRQDVVVVKKPA